MIRFWLRESNQGPRGLTPRRESALAQGDKSEGAGAILDVLLANLGARKSTASVSY